MIIREGITKVQVFNKNLSKRGPGKRDKKPFYNPSMESNRDLSVVFVQWLANKSSQNLHLLDGLGATGIRGVRLANEVHGNINVTINDLEKEAFLLIKRNIEMNRLKNANACNKNLNVLLSERKYHYIDIDPFGSPVPFIDSAMRSIYNNGVIACTATDTATLCGVYPEVCKRRYGAVPSHSLLMHEIGLRILVGFICREAAKYDKGIQPLLCYSSNYYFRTYIRVKKGKRFANESVEKISLVKDNVGPLWLGRLNDRTTVQEMRNILFEKKLNTKKILWKLLSLLEEEADAPPFFYTTEEIASELGMGMPKMKRIFALLRENGYYVTRTHFTPIGFKTDVPKHKILEILKSQAKS
jgi:tRNA (guanine26-N2/guanine27-N2)-dimethyltransferase